MLDALSLQIKPLLAEAHIAGTKGFIARAPVLDAAEKLFRTRGYNTARMGDIADAAVYSQLLSKMVVICDRICKLLVCGCSLSLLFIDFPCVGTKV